MGLSLFGDETETASTASSAGAPLAARMRPRTLDEFVGQEHIVGEGHVLRAAIAGDRVPSMILWGPPGTGKTTLAQIVAASTGAQFAAISAVSAGVADLRRVMNDAAQRRRAGKRTVLFIDEIHRFNKSQQDAVLPFVEDGTVTLIGATTENPSFEVNSALLSRSRVFVLRALTDDDVRRIVVHALADEERGLGALQVRIEDDALDALVGLANGDARVALGTLEFAASSARPNADGVRTIDRALIADALQRRATTYDKKGDAHYDVISAFIKSIRGSDPDGAVYWLARMIDAGEDALFIARRLVILASEDVGLADSRGLSVAIAAQHTRRSISRPHRSRIASAARTARHLRMSTKPATTRSRWLCETRRPRSCVNSVMAPTIATRIPIMRRCRTAKIRPPPLVSSTIFRKRCASARTTSRAIKARNAACAAGLKRAAGERHRHDGAYLSRLCRDDAAAPGSRRCDDRVSRRCSGQSKFDSC